MEGFLRIGLLIIAAVIFFLILFEARSRRRPKEFAHQEPTLDKIPEAQPKQQQKPELLVISVLAKPNQMFVSYDLLQALSAAGMQFGEMNIFHFYHPEEQTILFSLASATKPGTFDMDRVGDIACAGLTLFMDMKQVNDPEYAFEIMLKTAEQLAEDLDGELRAGQKNPWNDEILQQYREFSSYRKNVNA